MKKQRFWKENDSRKTREKTEQQTRVADDDELEKVAVGALDEGT